MKIISILKQRSTKSKNETEIKLALYKLAVDLQKRCSEHLKRVINVLPEFDLHDEKHSKKVVENIEKLLGDKKLKSLSIHELFFLHSSAFLHDCAMAPSEWEINVMRLTEGCENYYDNDFSIRHDFKAPLKFSDAEKIINNKKVHLYENFTEVAKWMFTPAQDEKWIKYLSELLIDYQGYRNTFSGELKTVKNQGEFSKLNESIRRDYIRTSHHARIGIYIQNLEKIFCPCFEQPVWGQQLANDLSSICQAHGETPSYVEQLDAKTEYYGSKSTNLQFVAMLLRLGDIIHYSFDRAPIDLQSAKYFKSRYSFKQWEIKNNGVHYSINKGKISFKAHCKDPESYYKLHEYIDWIDLEIQNYHNFQQKWTVKYICNLQDKVERSNIKYDDNVFTPKRGLSFSLNQAKILDLLMGVNLYKDKYACLRELYQNSLDAVRCMLSQNAVDGLSTKGQIEFYLSKETDGTYLCCMDNGIGMTKDIIESHLLKIGNTYYKSPNFYQKQAVWGWQFTPTSQFGIGILSCFMIGDKIEIATKPMGGDYISCAIDGPHEYFYYKKITSKDKEDIPVSGTIVKVRLKEETATQINNKKLRKIGLLLLGFDRYLLGQFQCYCSYQENWKEHLFNKINHFARVVPENIELTIGIENDTKLPIPSKPILIDYENSNLEITAEDFDFIDYLNSCRRMVTLPCKYCEMKEIIKTHQLVISYKDTKYITTLTLPKKEFTFESIDTLYAIPTIGEDGICIDGIHIDHNFSIDRDNYYSSALSRNGIISFNGEVRPQLSVDRTSIVDYPKECEEISKEISKLLIKYVINTVNNHIAEYKFKTNSKEFDLIWEYVFKKIGFADILFIREFSTTDYGDIEWKKLNDKLAEPQSIRNFIVSKNITILNYDFAKTDTFTKKLILTKLFSAEHIAVDDMNVSLTQENLTTSNFIPQRLPFEEHDVLIYADTWGVFDKHFDIVSNLYPLIPKCLFDLLDGEEAQIVNSRIKSVAHFCNGIMALFTQNPLLVEKELGLCQIERSVFERKKNNFRNFERRRSKFWLSELNQKYVISNQKERYVLLAYIVPSELSTEESDALGKYKKNDNCDLSYIQGIQEGWSLLMTGMKEENIVIFSGKTTREHLVSLISDNFWETYKDFTFKFTDGVLMQKNMVVP